MSAHSVYNIDPNLRKVIQQHLTTYRKSERNKEDLTLLATSFESIYQDQNAKDAMTNQQTLVTKAIAHEIRALQSQLQTQRQSQSDEDTLLSGLLISWQARYEVLDKQACQHTDVQTDASKLKATASTLSATPNLQPLYTPVTTPSITTSSITAPSPKPLASNNTRPTPELITSLSSYTPASWWRVIAISLLVWMVVKLPEWTLIPYVNKIDDSLYYSLIAPVCVIAGLASYFLSIQNGHDTQQNKQSADIKKKQPYWLGAIVLYGLFLFTAVWRLDHSRYEFYADGTVFMMILHSPILLIGLLGAVMYSHALKSWRARLAYLHYLGEVGVFSILILFGGILLTAFTLALFSLSNNYYIDKWYISLIVPLGIVATPIVASHLYLTVFYERSRVASILLQVFSPLCAITFLVYLGSLMASGTLPTEDREALIGINALLIIIWMMSVYHIIVRRSKANQDRVLPSIGVSIGDNTVADSLLINNTGEDNVNNQNTFGFMDSVTAFMLTVVSVFNVVILYSMIHRFVNYGFTLNRFIVTGVNIIIFIHLCLIGYQYLQLWRYPKRGDSELKQSITRYLPVYAIWSLFVVIIVMVNAWFE